jgi:hypothetical protein
MDYLVGKIITLKQDGSSSRTRLMTPGISSYLAKHGYPIGGTRANIPFSPPGQSGNHLALIPNDDDHVTTLRSHQFLRAVGYRSPLEFYFEHQQDDPSSSPVRCRPAAIHPGWVGSQ